MAHDDANPDSLISRLSRPLTSPAAREDFRLAAEAALSHEAVRGEGADFRTVASLQSRYFSPPSDARAAWDVQRELRPTKLKDAPPIEYGGDLRHVRHRKQQR